MLMSLKRSMDALQIYGEKTQAKKESSKEAEVLITLKDDAFWMSLTRLILLLKPIDEAIHMSEDSHSDLGKVAIYWKKVETHLINSISCRDFGKDLETFNHTQLQVQMAKQLGDLNWAAFYLHPINCDIDMTPELEAAVHRVIRKYCTADPNAAIIEFAAFWGKDGSFYRSSCWDYTNNPKEFWQLQVSILIIFQSCFF